MACRPVAADIVIIKGGRVLLIKRGHEPFKGMWALPGGRLEENESIEECAVREAKGEIGADVEIKKLVGVYSKPDRDPRKIVAIAFLCDVEGDIKAGDDAVEARWFEIEEVKKMRLASDHNKIIEDALRLIK